MINFKSIHIGQMIEKEVIRRNIGMPRICNFIKCSEAEILEMYQCMSLDTEILLRWSKILEYDLFRIYSQHLILYSPIPKVTNDIVGIKKTALPQFRKNIYTKEIIDFILEQFYSGQMTKAQIMERYGIPKTTFQKWIYKY
ncbi:hypothetical protein J2810_000890 [Chryseobacterium rhizosphaerae]|uniref:transposase n=1 Tax=Chryseobacterium rhizosphaerae TaxID=395937 RepID=UPI002855671B|nr:transposase [Chryseobacterium rhizosphaerae]MDR6544848.1 hypothetical protein [Chryseobacterium rhizosphaerae]